MKIYNNYQGYGLISRVLHWGIAIGIIGMFAMGLWMRSLGYYHPWYHPAPEIHKMAGVILVGFMILRLFWRWINPQPDSSSLKNWERHGASLAHAGFYVLVLLLGVSGYLLSTVDGRNIDMFGLFEIPPLLVSKGLEKLAGEVHEITAYVIIALAAVHALAALKHIILSIKMIRSGR